MLITHKDLKDVTEKELKEALGYVKRHPKMYPKDTVDRLKSLQKWPDKPLEILDRVAIIRLVNAIETGVYGEQLRKEREAEHEACKGDGCE